MVRRSLLRTPFLLALLATPVAVVAACGSTTKGPDLLTRMSSAGKTAESFGYAAYGAPSTGTVAEGKEAKVALNLKEGCYQIFVFDGDGLKSVDLTLADASGKSIGQATKDEGQSSIKECVSDTGAYTLVVKSAGGGGPFIAQPYAAGSKGTGDPTDNGNPDCTGDDCPDDGGPVGNESDCSQGGELTAGSTLKGTTSHKTLNQHLSCTASDGTVAVYRLRVDGRHKLVIDMSAKYDAAVGLFRAATDGYLCDQPNELECSDDAEGTTTKSHLEAVVDTGDYGVIVGGFDGDHGEFELKTRLDDAPSLETICATARPISTGAKVSDVLDGDGSSFHPTCSTGDGDEALYKLETKARQRVRVSARGPSGDFSVSLRSRCEDASSEVGCSNRRWNYDAVYWQGTLNAGLYTVIADTSESTQGGSIELNVESAPDAGSGTAEADSCKDAKAIVSSTTPVTIDTLQAKGDLKASCASDAGADVVYKLDVKTKSRLFASANAGDDEGKMVVAVQKACGDTKGEVACELLQKGVDATVDPGTYYLVVKGKGADDFGRVKMSVRTRDLAEAQKACKTAPKLVSGTSISDNTTNAPDRFISPACGGAVTSQQSGDKVYQFTLATKSHVNIQLKNSGPTMSFYNSILSLRSDCNDPTRGEITCASPYSKYIDRDLDAGTYYIVVDGYGTKQEGQFTIEMNAKAIK